MRTRTRQAIAVGAVLILVFSLVVVWNIADVRARSNAAAKAAKEARANRTTTVHTTTRTTTSNGGTTTKDSDHDGVPDSTDQCPNMQETHNGYRDGDGCPDTITTTRAS